MTNKKIKILLIEYVFRGSKKMCMLEIINILFNLTCAAKNE
jgi:hypothetical protein